MAALLLLTCFVRTFPWRLDDYDQAKQAFTSLEMVKGGQWWFQHTPGLRNVATKPPLIGWISAAIYGVTGSWEWAWRLPGLLAAGVLVVLLWREGERLLAGFGGALAAGAFGFNLLTPRLSLLVRTDTPLCFWITLAGLIVTRHVRERDVPWTQRDRWLVFAFLLAANMTKGPIAYAFLLPGMIAWSVVVYRRGGRWHDAWGGWWHWVTPLAPFLVWLEQGMTNMPGFYQQVVVREFLGRFTAGEAAVHHTGPVWSYFLVLLGRWAPWSVLLLAVRFRASRVWWSLCRDPFTLWLICWAAGGLVFMSLVPSKRTDRIYPVVPPLCLVLTALVARARRPEGVAEAATVEWPVDWAKIALVVAAAIPLVDAVKSVGTAYSHGEVAPSRFGAQVREMMAGDKRVELVAGQHSVAGEEAMVVYLRRVKLLTPGEADKRAREGSLDAVVVNEDNLDYARGLLGAFDPAKPVLASAEKEQRFLLLEKVAEGVAVARPPGAATPAPTVGGKRQKARVPSTKMP